MKTTKPKSKHQTINVALLRKIKQRILQRPRQFIMDEFFAPLDSVGNKASHCGTACCIAGWAVVLGGEAKNPRIAKQWIGHNAWDKAEVLLGLSNPVILFMVHRWPQPYLSQFEDATTATAKAQIAARRIDHFIKHRQ